MITATGSQIIVKLLEQMGIGMVAGIPGGSILPLYDELAKSSIKHVLVRQEQAAGFIAQGVARSTGKVAVCMATSGPGAMNLLTAIADARCDSVPIVAITGQVNSSLIGTDAFQEADTFGLSFPITKHSMMVKSAAELFEALPKAFAIAKDGRPGPVLIDIPRDVQCQKFSFKAWPSEKELKYSMPVKTDSATRIKEVVPLMAKSLLEAKKPVLYVGGGCNNPKSSLAVNAFLEGYNCAVVTSLMGIGTVPRSAVCNMGMVGMHGSYAANVAMHDADLVLAAGVRFDDRATGQIASFCPNAKILHVDVDAAEINKILPAEHYLVAPTEKVFPLVTELTKSASKSSASAKERASWVKALKKTFDETESFELGRNKKIPRESVNPRSFINGIPEEAKKAGVKPENIIVTTDVGQHQMWSAQYYPVEQARQFLTSGSLGTMGFGLPTAIGAALAAKTKRVVCISGDGSILMNIQELATLREQNLNVTVFVLQNGSLGMVRQQQEYLFAKNYSASVFDANPDFLQIAKGFGIDAVDANSDPDWAKKAFAKGPHLVVLRIDMSENVLPFVSAGKPNIDAIRN